MTHTINISHPSHIFCSFFLSFSLFLSHFLSPTLSFSFSLSLHLAQYQVGQLYSVAEASKNETGGGEGIEVLKNEPYEMECGEKGQFTHKIYHLKSKVPGFNEYMKDDFMIKIETWHKPDMGTLENVHDWNDIDWKEVEVVPIDIANRESVAAGDYKPEEDPAVFHSEKTGRGPLGPDWKNELKSDCPYMCAYKLVTVKFKWWGLTTKVENFIHRQERRIFTNFHRQLFCWIDSWIELTMEDIRRMEEETQRELEEMRPKGNVRGTSATED
ncbi:Phosphatidylinositol transfer protein beta isoform [Merluccius polli]|uniref:Phosphatidylinositol transfer protein beta isoform n=1 Tax=Merluccius polli TaxID=89951 RepID=A0AA47N8S1_MERPO|nr:Phosphatidylinositol transfer protein beta isoform [Merluccius polli]